MTHSMPASAKATEPRKNLRGQGHGLRRAPAAPPRGSQHLPRALGDLASPGPRSPPAAPLPQDQRQPWLDVTPARGWGCRGAAPSSQQGSETGDPALAAWATSAFSRATRPASSPSGCSDPEPRVASQPAGGVGAREPCGRTSGPLFCRGAGRAVPGPSQAHGSACSVLGCAPPVPVGSGQQGTCAGRSVVPPSGVPCLAAEGALHLGSPRRVSAGAHWPPSSGQQLGGQTAASKACPSQDRRGVLGSRLGLSRPRAALRGSRRPR